MSSGSIRRAKKNAAGSAIAQRGALVRNELACIAEPLERRLLLAVSVSFHVAPKYTTPTKPDDIISADFNGDGKADLAISNRSNISISIFPGIGDGTFGTRLDYQVAGGSGRLVQADFDRDGHPDLAVAAAGKVSVLLNKGDGTFRPRADYAAATGLSAIAAADFNGDGAPDLAIANEGNLSSEDKGSLAILLNNGDGTFAPKVDYQAGLRPSSLAAGDFDGDGIVEVVVATRGWGSYPDDSSYVILFENSGDGVFSKADQHSTGDRVSAVASADFDGKGSTDLVETGTGQDYLTRWVVKNGFIVARSTVAAGQEPIAIAAADLDGNGSPDVAVLNRYGQSVRVLRNDGVYLKFTSGVEYGVGTNPARIAAADFNGDGKIDLAVTSLDSNTFSVLLNKGNASFDGRIDYPQTDGPSSVLSTDLNGDGKSDLIVHNEGLMPDRASSVVARLSNGDGTFGPEIKYMTGRSRTLSIPGSMTAADFNGDGIQDLAIAETVIPPDTYPDGWSGFLSVLLGRGDGRFVSKANLVLGNYAYSAVAADFDGDGDADLAAKSAPGLVVLLNDGYGNFTRKYEQASVEVRRLVVADFNGDGRPDLATNRSSGVSVFLNNGDGTFANPTDYTGAEGATVETADFNRDGKMDLASGNTTTNRVRLLLGAGNGLFPMSREVSVATDHQLSMIAEDFDGNGFPDMALLTDDGYYKSLRVLLNRGDLVFSSFIYPVGYFPYTLTSGDFNGDGRPDLAALNGPRDGDPCVNILMNDTPAAPLAVTSSPSIYVKRSGRYIYVWKNADGSGAPAMMQSLFTTSMISLAGAATETITLDFSDGNFIPEGGININTNGGIQTLNVIGSEPVPLSITGTGTVRVGSVPGKTLALGSLSLAAGAKLDLADNSLVLLGKSQADIAGLVISARDGDPAWSGPGIGSSAAKPDQGLAIEQLGQDVKLKLTWNGDLNLDGRVNADDYFFIDQGFLQRPAAPTYHDGDFNFDGKINADDYFLIDQAFLNQKDIVLGSLVPPRSPLSSANAASAAPKVRTESIFSDRLVPEVWN